MTTTELTTLLTGLWGKVKGHVTAAIGNLAAVATSGDYDDLTNKPTIPDVSGKQDKRTLEDNSSASGAVTIYPDKYHDLGVTDSANVVYPTRAGVVDGYSIEVTGVSSDVVDFMDRFAVYVSDAEDTAAVSALLAAQAANSGATASYTMSKSAWSGFFSACNEIDEVGEDTYPEADLQTSEDVDVPHQVPDFARADEFLFTFVCLTDNCALTLPAGVSYGNGLDFEADRKADRKFQVSISDGIALYAYVDLNS